MRMGIIFSGILWGSFFILLGISFILKHTMNVDIPVARIFFGVFLIYLGVQVIAGSNRKPWGKSCDVVFSGSKVTTDPRNGEYNVIFGKGAIDLTGVEVGDKDVFLKANTIFGSSTVRLKAGLPALVRASAAFGNVRLPDGNAAAFGNCLYKTKTYREGKPHLDLELNAVFGEAQLVAEE